MTASARADAAAPAAAPVPAPRPTVEQAHHVTVVDGRFAHAECSCGWRTAGRRDRRALRREARDHALLYADGTQLLAPEDDGSARR